MIIETILGSIAIFASTNANDIPVLIGLFIGPYKTRNIVLGQFIGVGVLTLINILLAHELIRTSEYFEWSRSTIGLIGFLPITVGFREFFQLWKHSKHESNQKPENRFGEIIGVASIAITNGGDNLAMCTPFFVSHIENERVIFLVFGIMVGVWCGFLKWLSGHISRRFRLERFTKIIRILLPGILIGVGIYTLWFNKTFQLMIA